MWVMHWENTLTSLLAAPSNRVFSHKENSPRDTNFPLWAEYFVKVCGYQSSTEMEPQMCGAKLAPSHIARAGWPPCPCWEPSRGPAATLAPLAGPACNSLAPWKPTFCLSPKIRPFIYLFLEQISSMFFRSKVSHHNKHHGRGLSNAQSRNLIWVRDRHGSPDLCICTAVFWSEDLLPQGSLSASPHSDSCPEHGPGNIFASMKPPAQSTLCGFASNSK